MLIQFTNWFTKITAFPVQLVCFRTKIHYEAKESQARHFKGSAIILSNHTSVFDYAVYLFVFPFRTVRYQMAEVLFKKQPLGLFLSALGGILVNRDAFDFSFIEKTVDILNKGGAVGIFPEGRLPKEGEATPLPFKESAARIALEANSPIIPVYTNGSYFNKKRAEVIIGKAIYPSEVDSLPVSDSEKIKALTEICRNRIIELGQLLNEK